MSDLPIGQKIKAVREQKELTQKEVADKIGVTKQFYGRVENGKTNPTLKTLTAITDVLNCKIDLVVNN